MIRSNNDQFTAKYSRLDNSFMVVIKSRDLVRDGSIVLASDMGQNTVKFGAVNMDSVVAFNFVVDGVSVNAVTVK